MALVERLVANLSHLPFTWETDPIEPNRSKIWALRRYETINGLRGCQECGEKSMKDTDALISSDQFVPAHGNLKDPKRVSLIFQEAICCGHGRSRLYANKSRNRDILESWRRPPKGT